MSLIGKKLLGLGYRPSKRKRSAEIINYAQAKNIGILYTYEDEKKEESIDKLLTLINNEKHTQVLCFIDSKEMVSSKHPSFHVDQLNNWGKINSKEVDDFQNFNFDFLIHLDFEPNEVAKSLLHRTKAKCRVGFHSEEVTDYYELMIGMNKSAGSTNFAEQIIKYIKAIK